jgi:predicted negative regulator of RcsB-dependent stress response
MLKPKKKLTKKELKSDPLFEALEEGKELYDKYKNPFYIILGGVFAILFIAWVWNNNIVTTQNEAMLETTKVLNAYANNPNANVISELEMVVSEYGDVAGAELAPYYLGVSKLDSNDIDGAKELFTMVSNTVSDPIIKLAATSKLAECYVRAEQFQDAAATYLKAAKITKGDMQDGLKISAALSYFNANNMSESKSILQDLLDKKISKDNRTNAEYLLGKISQ